MPKRGGEGLDESAMMLWAEKLVEKGEAVDITSAEAWIADLEAKNPTYFAKRVKVYRKADLDYYAKNVNALLTPPRIVALDAASTQGGRHRTHHP